MLFFLYVRTGVGADKGVCQSELPNGVKDVMWWSCPERSISDLLMAVFPYNERVAEQLAVSLSWFSA
jgi:hypothetical protein